ncbi:MAG: hypothetical protein MK486_15355 [Gemmatimonadetes bacterium]|jgi:hypothetical protein|nr:hypothetical protein [Gemmatimonadota bacterium]
MQSLPDNWLSLIGLLAILATAAWLGDFIATRSFRVIARGIAGRTKCTWDDRVIGRKVFARIAHNET